MKYSHVMEYVSRTPWAILPEKMQELLSVLAFRAAGHRFTAEEIRARIGDGQAAGGATRPSRKIAIIPIRGVIAHRMGSMDESSGGTSCEAISGMLRQVLADDRIDTILLDCDTPGGSVVGVAELAAEIYAARRSKRIVAIANGLCASAGYHLASQAHEIVAIPSARVGSIGVFAVHSSLERALEKEGVKVTIVQFGEFKTEGNPFQDLTADAHAQMQRHVDQCGDKFVADVARGRGVSPTFVRGHYGDGRSFTSLDARAAGLIDRVGTLSETLERAASGAMGDVSTRASDIAWQLEMQPQWLELSLPAGMSIARRPPEAARQAEVARTNAIDRQRIEFELALLQL